MLGLLQQHQYIFLFAGIVIGGETVLIPAVYLAVIGVFNFIPLIIITIIATAVSDSAWYMLGRILAIEKIKTLKMFQRRKELFNKATVLFDRHGLRLLFFSKFVYGSRIITQVLCGVSGIGYVRYIIVNTLGIVTWLTAILAVGAAIGGSLDTLRIVAHRGELLFILFFIIVIFLHVWTKKIMNKC